MIKSRYCAVESLKIMGSASKEVMGPNINVLLWNVFKCKKKDWERDFVSLISDKDLILLQEAILNSPFDILFNRSQQHQWIMASSFKNVRTNIETGVKTGSTVAASEHYFSVSSHGEPITKTKKMLLATEYIMPVDRQSVIEKTLMVVNFHIINFVSFDKFKAHLDQVLHIFERHNGPIIFAGDFNTWNTKRLSYFKELARSFSLEEVELLRRPKFSHLLQHLDHIYCRGLEVVKVKVHTDIHSSDHYPISLSLRV
ncbi:MAG: endonuclease/exonuclease/phosphatase family protein [Oleibacter sp.]|nr:endonuclease/exonuclease/phosphatase family protein [Thalassolituus sp.]